MNINILNKKKKKKNIFSDDEESDKKDEKEHENGIKVPEESENLVSTNTTEQIHCGGNIDAEAGKATSTNEEGAKVAVTEKEMSENAENKTDIRESNDEINGEPTKLRGDNEQEQDTSNIQKENVLKKKKKKLRRLEKSIEDETETEESVQHNLEQISQQEIHNEKQVRKLSKKDFIIKNYAHEKKQKEEKHKGKSDPYNDGHEIPVERREPVHDTASDRDTVEQSVERKRKEKKKINDDESSHDRDDIYHNPDNSEDDEKNYEEVYHGDGPLGTEEEEEDKFSQDLSDEEEKRNKHIKKKKKKTKEDIPKLNESERNKFKLDKDEDNMTYLKERKKKKMKNSKLMLDVNPNEEKLKLKLICISFHKKEYNIEEFIFESLKVIIPQNKTELFLNQQNIIIDSTSRDDLKNLEIFWFDRLTKNRRRSIMNCFTTLSKMSPKEMEDNLNTSPPNVASANEPLINDSKNIPNSSQNVADSSKNIPDSSKNVPDSSKNVPDSSKNVPDISQNVPDSSKNVPDNSQNATDSPKNVAHNSASIPITASNIIDANENISNVSHNPTIDGSNVASYTPDTSRTAGKNINGLEDIFNKKKDTIIVDYLAALCTEQVKLIKLYISYIRKNIYDMSSITENNEKIKEMNILEPIKRREMFFYLNLCISMNYIQEQSPNVYTPPIDVTPDIRGFNLHPMFSHINKKINEQRKGNIKNPWEKLKLLKKSKKTDSENKNHDNSVHKCEVDAHMVKKKNEANEEEEEEKEEEKEEEREVTATTESAAGGGRVAAAEAEEEDSEKRKNDKYTGDNDMSQKKSLEDEGKKKKALEEMKKKKKEKDDKKVYNVYSLLESAAQYFGEGPKYSNPNMHEFYKSNINQLVYIKPPNNIDEKNILINYFLQFPSITKKLEYNKRRIYAENYGLVKIVKNNENLPINFTLHTQPWLLESYEHLWNEQNKLNNFDIFNMSNLLDDNDDDDDFGGGGFEYNQFSLTKPEIVKPEIVKPEIAKPESAKPESAKPESAKSETVQQDGVGSVWSNSHSPSKRDQKNVASTSEIKKRDSKSKSEFLTKKIKKIFPTKDSKQLKLTSFVSKEKISKYMNVTKKEEREEQDKDKQTLGESNNVPIINQQEEQTNDSTVVANENEETEYIKIKIKKKRVLDDEAINDIYADQKTKIKSNDNQKNGTDNEINFSNEQKEQNINRENCTSTTSLINEFENDDMNEKENRMYHEESKIIKNIRKKNENLDEEEEMKKENDNINDHYKKTEISGNQNADEEKNEKVVEDKKGNADNVKNSEYKDIKESIAKERKSLRHEKMQHMFELEAEESDDENIEDLEERRRAQMLKQNNQTEESEDDEQYNSEELNEFINNEEYNSDNEIVKLKHKQEMEKLEEDIFIKKFTYQGKEFNNELTNREKLELAKEKELLRRKKLLFNSTLGHVKLSDFESDSSTSSNASLKKRIKNTLYEPFTELENVKLSKRNNNIIGSSYKENIFKRGEDIRNLEDQQRRKILEKIDNVMYTKEIKTNEGKRIVIKKKRKIRFHQDLSDVTVTEEEQVDTYEKTKKKPKKVNTILVEQSKPSSVNTLNKTVNHHNKASIKWNNNIKDISELDTPTNSEVFKGFRKVENAQ
ncbi:hypothetical protein, conserved [Plasmodium gonderi]|uniref:Uncharacterized protein n=1 Tax=Plasmodium gonderi TaxID=77519 RepID=A0A1Y1JHY4_PLAGO|nr:hypothetical protein, conserved [Plasmodium gonderi]GAW82121.1 hypothetical protein, conserved [Plasmodium gonderi]